MSKLSFSISCVPRFVANLDKARHKATNLKGQTTFEIRCANVLQIRPQFSKIRAENPVLPENSVLLEIIVILEIRSKISKIRHKIAEILEGRHEIPGICPENLEIRDLKFLIFGLESTKPDSNALEYGLKP